MYVSLYMQSQNGTAVISTRFENGRIYCRFTRTIQVQNEAEDRPLDVASFVLLAAGSARGKINSLVNQECGKLLVSKYTL